MKPISMLDMCLKRFLKEITLLIRTYQAGCCIKKKKIMGNVTYIKDKMREKAKREILDKHNK